MRLFLLLIVFTSLLGCAKFKEGDCIQNTSDATIWRITAVHITKYSAQGWYSGKWGYSVNGLSFDTFDSRYVKITCPFSEKTIQ